MLIKDDTLKILSDALVSNPNNEIAVLDLRWVLVTHVVKLAFDLP